MAPRRGFSLLELLVALAVGGLVLAAVVQVCVGQQRALGGQEELADAHQNARIGLEELTRALASLGAGTAGDRGQLSLLLAHPFQVVFTADLDPAQGAQAPGTAVPGRQAGDPHPTVPGTYAAAPAETYRFTLDRTGDGAVDGTDCTRGEQYTLWREVNGGPVREVALGVANPRVGVALFRYEGDFDGDGTSEVLERVTAATSSRVAAGVPLERVVRRISLDLVTETGSRDRRTGEYGRARLVTSVAPRCLCPP